MALKVDELYFYPIKSFRGLRVDSLSFDELGPLWDRNWTLIDDRGLVLTQRELPLLATLRLQFDPDSHLELTAAGFGSMDFGLEEQEGDSVRVVVWKAEMPAVEVSREVSQWLSDVLHRPVRLVRMTDARSREVKDFPGHFVRFVDDRPVLVISRESLLDLEKRSGQALEMIRFRPNVVVSGAELPHSEDTWPSFQVGAMKFQALKPCSRCVITTLDPLTGVKGPEPLRTLGTYRRQEKGLMFGYYYGHLGPGTIRVGEPVSLAD